MRINREQRVWEKLDLEEKRKEAMITQREELTEVWMKALFQMEW